MYNVLYNWIRRYLGKEFIVVESKWNNAYPCDVGKYMVISPARNVVWKTNMKKDKAYELCKHLNKRKDK